jgi:hypothetical protein
MPQVRGNRARRGAREEEERITLEDVFSLFRPLLPPRRVLRQLCDHLTQSRVEILKGVKAIIDSRIDQLEGRGQKRRGVERIRIED